MKDVITLRGERELWIDFIHRAKKGKKKAWDILSPFLKKFVSSNQETRVLLMLFPKDLIDEILTKDDPDGFIGEAIRESLGRNR